MTTYFPIPKGRLSSLLEEDVAVGSLDRLPCAPARQLCKAFPDGIWLVEFAMQYPALLPQRVVTALHMSPNQPSVLVHGWH